MEDLEPWNMFTNDFMPDAANMGDDANGAGGGGEEADGVDISFNIPSPVQDMQVKEEPQDIEEIIDDEMDNAPFHFLADASNHHGQNKLGNNADNDDALFDFGLDSSNSQNLSNFSKSTTAAEKDFSNLSPEDQYYNSMVKFEDAVIYICPGCGHEFTSQEAWKNHLNVVHMFNTKRGLNFIQLDKLYHECMECHKRIAMHSMENLLKHKFTHLPYRCSKCMVCKRQYKYRQDLMVHLRMTHREDLIAVLKKEHKNHKNPHTQPESIRSILSRPEGGVNINQKPRSSNISIGNIKENAVDLFDSNTNDNIEVKNELIREDEDDLEMMMGDDSEPPPTKRHAKDLSAFLEDGSTNGSGGGGGEHQNRSARAKTSTSDDIDDSLEEYILFTCPQCGTECETQAQWRQHIDFVHEFGTRRGLNFRELLNQQAQCMGCNQEFANIYKDSKCLWCEDVVSTRKDKDEAYKKLLTKYQEFHPNATHKTVVSKLSSMRSCVTRELNKVQQNSKHVPQLVYFKAMKGIVLHRQGVKVKEGSNTAVPVTDVYKFSRDDKQQTMPAEGVAEELPAVTPNVFIKAEVASEGDAEMSAVTVPELAEEWEPTVAEVQPLDLIVQNRQHSYAIPGQQWLYDRFDAIAIDIASDLCKMSQHQRMMAKNDIKQILVKCRKNQFNK